MRHVDGIYFALPTLLELNLIENTCNLRFKRKFSEHSSTMTNSKTRTRNNFDSPWKGALETCFRDFFAFAFPQEQSLVDWQRGFEFLDKEFHEAVRGVRSLKATAKQQTVDKLVKLWTVEGTEEWVLIHVEVQNQRERNFEERMYIYHSLIYRRYRRRVATIVILSDDDQNWRPSEFAYELFGNKLSFKFKVLKLADYRQQWLELEESNNPFATVIMAHLIAQDTRKDLEKRCSNKITIIKRLYKKGYEKSVVDHILKFVDWVLILPDKLEEECWMELGKYKGEAKMEYITSWERMGHKRGFEEGIEKGLERARKLLLKGLKVQLEVQFGQEGRKLWPEISKLKSPEELSAFQIKLARAKHLEDLTPGH